MLILDNEISRARFAVHLELTENRLILDNEITRARFVVHYESYTRGSTTFLVDSNKFLTSAHGSHLSHSNLSMSYSPTKLRNGAFLLAKRAKCLRSSTQLSQ